MSSPHLLRLERGRCAFLCCDLQSEFRSRIYLFEHVLHGATVLTQAAAILGIPLIASEQLPENMGETLVEVSRARLVYSKTTLSMIDERFPAEVLEAKDTFILFGVQAHICVQQTALDLLNQHKNVVVVTDAVSSPRPLDRSTALHRLSRAGAVLMTAESVMLELIKTKDAPEYPELYALGERIAEYADNNEVLTTL